MRRGRGGVKGERRAARVERRGASDEGQAGSERYKNRRQMRYEIGEDKARAEGGEGQGPARRTASLAAAPPVEPFAASLTAAAPVPPAPDSPAALTRSRSLSYKLIFLSLTHSSTHNPPPLSPTLYSPQFFYRFCQSFTRTLSVYFFSEPPPFDFLGSDRILFLAQIGS